jgi:hypothetical protein
MADFLSPLDPFRTVARQHRDFNRADDAAEVAANLLREELIEQLLNGRGHLDTALDCLAEHGIDPDAWIDQTLANIDYVIDAGIRFEPTETGLFLPAVTRP